MFGRNRINVGLRECRSVSGAVLLDVREAEEFRSGHIPGAVNVPLSRIGAVGLPRETPLYVYCLRGSRSKKAVSVLRRMGYAAKSIGGITGYKGQREK